MTNAEYQRLLRQARRSYPRLTREAMTELKKIYIKAGELAAAEVRRATAAGLADITIDSWTTLIRQLEVGATMIVNDLSERIPSVVGIGADRLGEIDQRFIYDAVERAGAGALVSRTGVQNLYRGVNDRVIRSLVNRVYQDGYTFSDRVWQAGVSYQNQIKNVVGAGIAQGRDPVKIAKDIQVYIADGKIKLANRYGPDLERGTREFMKRIGNRVDWRALRLVRSELYASLQDATREQGRVNPACTDMYDWILEAGRQHWDCGCPDAAESGPYHYNDVPGYQHSNCRCQLRQVLRDGNEFFNDLKSWVEGSRVGYLDDWYRDFYAPAA